MSRSLEGADHLPCLSSAPSRGWGKVLGRVVLNNIKDGLSVKLLPGSLTTRNECPVH